MKLRAKLDLGFHFLSAVVFSFFIYAKYHDLVYVLIFISGDIFIDLDHLVDYFIYYKKHISIKKFLESKYLDSGKVYLFLHSWELVTFLYLLALLLNSGKLLVFVLGLVIHLIIDNLQRSKPLFYFLLYRYSKKFSVDVLEPEVNFYKG